MLGTPFSAQDELLLVDLMQRLRDRVQPEAQPFTRPLTTDEHTAAEHLFDGVPARHAGAEVDKSRARRTECGICDSINHPDLVPDVLYEDENWIVRHIAAP